jgi:Tol biopolymer transport system component
MKRLALFLSCLFLGVGFASCSDSTGPGSLSDGWILFTGQAALEPGNPVIYAIRPDGTGLRKVTSGLGQALYPRWSRDGNQIAYVTVGPDQIDQVWLMKRDGSNAHSIATASGCSSSFTRLTWSPSGDRIIAECYLFGDVVINVADKTSYSLSDQWGRVANDPDWSPSADKILYSSSSSTYVANLDGSAVSLFGSPAAEPAWSPDGTRVAFISNGGNQPPSLFVANVDGSAAKRLTFPLNYYFTDQWPAWSHDGTQIVYARGDGTNRMAWALHVIRPDGSGDKVITPDTLWATKASW